MAETDENAETAPLKLDKIPSETASVQLPQFEAREQAGQLQVKSQNRSIKTPTSGSNRRKCFGS